MKTKKSDIKKVTWPGGCSRTFFYTLNRELGCPKDAEECAADTLSGGIMLRGHQCGMLWGSALAAGAESFRQNSDRGKAIASAITATQRIVESFTKRTGTLNCREITSCDFTKKTDFLKFMLKFILYIDRSCFKFADIWAPESIKSAVEGLSLQVEELTHYPVSCASEVVKKTGGSEEEIVAAAGFAGGLGLSGNGCGALSAAIWMKSLEWNRKHPGKSSYKNPYAEKTLDAFLSETGSEFTCRNITGRCFRTIDEHSEFINNGGCDRLINILAKS